MIWSWLFRLKNVYSQFKQDRLKPLSNPISQPPGCFIPFLIPTSFHCVSCTCHHHRWRLRILQRVKVWGDCPHNITFFPWTNFLFDDVRLSGTVWKFGSRDPSLTPLRFSTLCPSVHYHSVDIHSGILRFYQDRVSDGFKSWWYWFDSWLWIRPELLTSGVTRVNRNPHIGLKSDSVYVSLCLSLIEKARSEEKTYIWVSVWWKTKS
jgi:hypothetical protein